MKMNDQTKVIVACTIALISVDIAVRGGWMSRQPQTISCTDCAGTVTAREFRLVDADGNLKAHLTTDESGDPGLILYDRNGLRRAQLDTFDQVPSLILNGPDERHSAYFGVDEAGKSFLTMYGENGEQIVSMDTTGTQPVIWTSTESLFQK